MRIAIDPPVQSDRYVFTHDISVRFAETDAMGIVHHAAYLPYLEETRVEFLAGEGHPYEQMHGDGVDIGVIELWCSYRTPLRFGDRVRVHLACGPHSGATFQVLYLVTVRDAVALTAVTAHACMDRSGRPQRMPVWLRDLTVSRSLR